METLAEKIDRAQKAGAEDLWKIIRDSHPEVVSRAILNRNLTEEMAVFVARRDSTPAEVLGFLASDIRFRESYALKVALCRNPKTPQRVALSLLKFIKIFDLADLTKDQRVPTVLRQKVEQSIFDRIKALPSGMKTTLAKRASSGVVMALIESGDERVIKACLESPTLTEGHIYRIINRPSVKQIVLRLIAEHPKWSLRYPVRYALIRNFYTPMAAAVQFISSMKTADLKDLYSDPKLPSSTRPFIFRELLEREETTETGTDEVFEVMEEESSS